MSVLKLGSTGPEVKELQKLLGTSVDGSFGPHTEALVKVFQTGHDLVADGIVGPLTWDLLRTSSTFLRDNDTLLDEPIYADTSMSSTDKVTQDIVRSISKYGLLIHEITRILNIDEATAHAVIAVESAGVGVIDNRIVIRFEAHQFWNRWGHNDVSTFSKYWTFNTPEPWKDQTYLGEPYHGNQDLEWLSFSRARLLNEAAAVESISIGLGQLMGFHWEILGFDCPTSFLVSQGTERAQLLTMFDFIVIHPAMLIALQNQDWRVFARWYNGSGQIDTYTNWLRDRYNIAQQILSGLNND